MLQQVSAQKDTIAQLDQVLQLPQVDQKQDTILVKQAHIVLQDLLMQFPVSQAMLVRII